MYDYLIEWNSFCILRRCSIHRDPHLSSEFESKSGRNHPVFCRKCFTNIFQRKLINDLDVFSTVLWSLFPLLPSLLAQSSCDLGKCFGIQYTSLNVSKWKTNATFFLDGRFIAFEVKYLWTVLYIQPRWFNLSHQIV